jgi:hypothetical protein
MIRMNDSMNINQYHTSNSKLRKLGVGLSLSIALVTGLSGCKGTPFAFPQTFPGFGAPSKVPAPGTGSFQVPNTYNGTPGTSSTSSGGLSGSSFGNGPTGLNNKTSQTSLPVANLVNSISQAESQLLNLTNNARNTVTRTADTVNSRVEQASARVDRFGQGVVQASNILSEAATAPIVSSPSLPDDSDLNTQVELPASSVPPSGRVSDNTDASWRAPIRR